jgi:hypothetical protein
MRLQPNSLGDVAYIYEFIANFSFFTTSFLFSLEAQAGYLNWHVHKLNRPVQLAHDSINMHHHQITFYIYINLWRAG